MKHAGQKSLDELDGLLKAIRTRPGIKEKSRGVFYRSGGRGSTSMKIPRACLPICRMARGGIASRSVCRRNGRL